MRKSNLADFVSEIRKIPTENEWIEFKLNHQSPEKIGEYISALANSACLHQVPEAYLVFGIGDDKHEIIGTSFFPNKRKGKGNEDLEPWLRRNIDPSIDFEIKEVDIDNKRVVIFFIPPAAFGPVKFMGKAYIRIGSSTTELEKFKEKEAVIWDRRRSFESKIALENVSEHQIFELLDHDRYYRLSGKTIPKNLSSVIDAFLQEKFLVKKRGGIHITNLGAVLLAVDMRKFETIRNKTVRVVTYTGANRLEAKKDMQGRMGYAIGFENLIAYIGSQLPDREKIEGGLREIQGNYPRKAIREFVANALVHQDFSVQGYSPLIEIFSDRMEISNAGKPIIKIDRFVDSAPCSRNEKLANALRIMRICEQRGSGVDRALAEIEMNQLPAPNFEETDSSVRVTIYFSKDLSGLTKLERCRACYYHACLMHVLNRGPITNASLCGRLGIDSKNKAIVSRILKDTREKGWIVPFDPENKSPKMTSYMPY